MPIKPRCCNPFSCFSAVEKRPDPTLAESGPGPSHDVADVPGVPGCYKAPLSGSSNVSLKHEGEDVDARLNVSGAPRCHDASLSGSSYVPKTRSEEEDVEGAPPCINEALTCSSSSGATKSRSDLISSIRKDIVEVEDVNLDDLMNHIAELLKLREEGKQQQASNLRKFPWPNVPGLQKLKEIVSIGTDLQKLQNMLSVTLTVGSELQDIIHGPVTALLKDMGKVSVASAGLLVVAHTLETLDDAFTNNKKCWDLIKAMSYVARIVKRLKERPQGMAQFVIPQATSLLVEGAIMCCNQIDGSTWKRLLAASKIKGDLSDIRQKLHAMYLQINTKTGFHLLSAVECKDLFLDICSSFEGWNWETMEINVGKDDLRMLESRALVTKATNGVASVHDVIVTLAHGMSKKESKVKFTNASELKKFLEEEDTEDIRGIWLTERKDVLKEEDDDDDRKVAVPASALDKFHNSLRVVQLGNSIKVEGTCSKIFEELFFFEAKISQLPFRDVSKFPQLRYLSYDPPNWVPSSLPSSLAIMNFNGKTFQTYK